MNFDFNQELKNVVSVAEATLREKELFVVYSRNGYPNGKKMTLEAIAQSLDNITRERVRQIEKKAMDKLNRWMRKMDILLRFTICFEKMYQLFRKESFENYQDFFEPSYITFAEYTSIVDKDLFYKSLALFLAISNNEARIKVSQEFNFVYNSNGISENEAALAILGLNSDVISVDDVEKFNDNEKKILFKNYRLLNGYYIKKGEIKRDIILSILDEGFIDGFHISSDKHLEKFKEIYKSKYGTECNITQRQIECAISNTDDYCLVNRGTYLRYDKCSKIPEDLLEQITEFIFQEGGTLYYSTIFGEFKDELCAIGITNWFYFKGVFDKQSAGTFYTRRSTLSVDSTKRFEDPISNYINDSKGIFTIQTLKNKFPNLEEWLFLQRIYNNKRIIGLEGRKFILVDNLNLNQEDLNTIKQFVITKIKESDYGIVSTRSLYPLLRIDNRDLCKRLGLANEQFGFFSLCAYLLSDKFKFSRPFIGDINEETITLSTVLSRYIEDELGDRFSFADLEPYAIKYNTAVNDKLRFVDSVAGKYLLVSNNDFIKINRIKIDNLEQIIDFLVTTVENCKEIKISNFNGYFLIPKNKNIYWNKQTLFSFINSFCLDKLEIEVTNYTFENIDYIIRSK